MEINVTIKFDEKAATLLSRVLDELKLMHTTVVCAKPDAESHAKETLTAVSEAPELTPAVQAPEAAETASAPAVKSGKPKTTIEDVRALAADVKVKHDAATVRNLLAEYKAKNISGLPENELDEFAEKLRKLL